MIIEYVSANPTGPLHIGNGRGAVLGDILANILKFSNYRTTKEYYVNNRGNQIDLLIRSVLYHLGKLTYEENFYQGEYLSKLVQENKNILLKLTEDKLKDYLIRYILDKLIKKTLKKFGTQFDNFYFETDLYKKNLDKKVIQILEKKKLIYESEGALWLNLKIFGEEKDEVLIKKNREPTYFFSDILYNYDKFFVRKFHYSIMIVGADHHDHLRRLKKTFEHIFKIEPKRLKLIEYQIVHLLKDGQPFKMSKRKGKLVTLDDLIEETGIEPIRFYFAKYSPEMTINFDIDLVKKENINNQVWYLLYTYARFNQILKKAKEKNFKFDYKKNIKTNLGNSFIYLIQKDNFKKIFRRINQFSAVVFDAALSLKQNLVISYLLKLSEELNSFYEKEIILTGEPKEIRFKILFINYIKKTLELGFNLLNIKPKEKLDNPKS
ncbi:MAG: arginine--tRNA ligase [Patescibacteria group bacterium]|nr:arginine--tRNA ligase [Patescibacteria group bacterium]